MFRGSEGNFLEAKAALYFGSGTIFLKRQISFHSAHSLVSAWPGQSAQFCETALYFNSGTIFLKRKSFGTKKLPSAFMSLSQSVGRLTPAALDVRICQMTCYDNAYQSPRGKTKGRMNPFGIGEINIGGMATGWAAEGAEQRG